MIHSAVISQQGTEPQKKTAKTHNIGGTRPSSSGVLFSLLTIPAGTLDETRYGGEYTTHVATRVRGHS